MQRKTLADGIEILVFTQQWQVVTQTKLRYQAING
jgi:hypothetical protein